MNSPDRGELALQKNDPIFEPHDATKHATQTTMESPFKFLQEVRSETNKVTWPSRRETMITTIMVFVMVGLASIFFFFADQLIRLVVTTILRIHT